MTGLTDIYAFGEWLKREYHGSNRKKLIIEPIAGGLINVIEVDLQDERYCTDDWRLTHGGAEK